MTSLKYFFNWTQQKVDHKNWKVLKYDIGEGWRRLFGLIVCKMKKYCIAPRRKRIYYMK
jgi:hypothetical protein